MAVDDVDLFTDDDVSEAIVRVWWRNRGFGRTDKVGAIGWYVVLLLVGW